MSLFAPTPPPVTSRSSWLAIGAALRAAPLLALDSETHPVSKQHPAPRPVAWGMASCTTWGEPLMTCLAGAGPWAIVRWGTGDRWEEVRVPVPHAGRELALECMRAATITRPATGHRVLYDLACAVAWGWLPAEEVARDLAAHEWACTRGSVAMLEQCEAPWLALLGTHGMWALRAGFLNKQDRRDRAKALALDELCRGRGVQGRKSSKEKDGWKLRWGELEQVPAPEWPAEARDYLADDCIQVGGLAATLPMSLRPGLALWALNLWEFFEPWLGEPIRYRTSIAREGEEVVDVRTGQFYIVQQGQVARYVNDPYVASAEVLVQEALDGLRAYRGDASPRQGWEVLAALGAGGPVLQ